ncbi:MAG: AAA family ATPase [Anaerolineae bacterium]|nr:AAA family ATPase [Anaerolineae bacterium]
MTTQSDPWVNVRTRHDLPADEVISALQKEIRRGHTENAALLAYEMATTSPELEQYLWYRLLVISVEDIGMGAPQAPVLMHALYQINQTFGHRGGEYLLLITHAVRYLCTCRKDRASDEMINWIKHAVEIEGVLPTIPDYALDMHTARGKALGRGSRHFWETGALLDPELPDRDTDYRQRILDLLEKADLS